MAASNPIHMASEISTLSSYEDNIQTLEQWIDNIPHKQNELTAGNGITITTEGEGKDLKTIITSSGSGGGSNISIEASGESPLSLDATTSGDIVTIHGEITEATEQNNGYMTSTQVTQLNSVIEDPLQYATAVTIEEIDALFD